MDVPERNSTVLHGLHRSFVFGSIAGILFLVFGLQLAINIVRSSTTFDEPAHIIAGYRYLQCADFGINPEHPPMLKLLAAAPLFLSSQITEPQGECGVKHTSKLEMFRLGGDFLVKNGIDPVVIPARIGSSVMSILLAIVLFLAAWELFGRIEALIALGVIAFEPTLIGHGSLVTTDMALAATALAAAYTLLRFCKAPSFLRLLVAGVFFGLMLSAKHSAVIFVPILLLAVVADAFFVRETERRLANSIGRRIFACAVVCVIGFGVLWAFYGFRLSALPGDSSDKVSVESYIQQNGRPEMISSGSARAVIALDGLHVLPESYVLGLADIVATGSRNTWIAGKAYSTGQWFYFPVAFIVKASIPLLILLPFGLALLFVSADSRRTALFLLMPAIAFFAIALTSKMNIGVRHILPVWPFFILFAVAGSVFIARRLPQIKYLVALVLIFHAVTAFRIAPNYIAFANDIFGGPNGSYKMLRDSSVDWGQSYKHAAEYLKKENISDCWWASFGNPAVSRATVPCRFLPDGFLMRPGAELDDVVPPQIDGTLLISVSNLPPRGGPEYATLLEMEPFAQLGGTILVFKGRFELPLVAAFSHSVRASWLTREGRAEEAVIEAMEGARLAPNDPRVYFHLGSAYAASGRAVEARTAFENTIKLATMNPGLFRNWEVRANSELGKLK